MKKLLFKWFNINTCEHEFMLDNQIKTVVCQKCGATYWVTYGDAYKEKRVKEFINKKLPQISNTMNKEKIQEFIDWSLFAFLVSVSAGIWGALIGAVIYFLKQLF